MLIEQRTSLRGEILVPGDKSISHRSIIFSSLSKGTTEIDGFSMGEDCINTIECFRKMQIVIEILSNNKIKVHGKGLHGLTPPTSVINSGRAGTTFRLLMGALVGQSSASLITRNDSVLKKSLGEVVKPLRQMGANIIGRDDGNLPPYKIYPSNLKGITYETALHNTFVKSPILIAGLYADGYTTVIEPIKSRDHSELILNYFGADIRVDGLKVISHRIAELYSQHVIIPGDISIASYFITAGLLVPNSDITIRNVGVNPTRTGILDIYKKMGAKIEILNERTLSNEQVADIHVVTSSLSSITIEGEIIPRLIDEIPMIVVAAAFAKGTTVIKDLKGFKIKESSRLKTLVFELSKMGASLHETEDGLIIEGGKSLRGTIIDSHGDYSLVMATSLAGLVAEGETMIRKSQIVDVVFPEFLTTLNKL